MTIRIKESRLREIVNEAVRAVLKGSASTDYECINEARSWSEGMRKNACVPRIAYDKGRSIVSEGIEYEPQGNEKGGIIVFSTDVNAVELSPNKVANWVKQKAETLKNRVTATRKIDRIANRNSLVGWTIGHYLDGRYKARNGKNFGENSLSVMIVGVDFDTMVKIAEEICSDFKQESVLLKDFSTGRILFVNPD